MRWLAALAALAVYVWVAVALLMAVVYFSHPAVGKGKHMTLRISPDGIAHIKHFEGCRLSSYYCSGGVCTIGFGHTGRDVKPGMTITHERAEELLRQDLAKAEKDVSELVKTPLTQGMHDAMVDLIFNVGRDAIAKSTLLKLLNKRQYDDAGNQLMRWVHSGSRVTPGLQRRRQAAREFWFGRD